MDLEFSPSFDRVPIHAEIKGKIDVKSGVYESMQIERTENTKARGTTEFLVYSEGDKFVGVCLTFDIVEEGNDPVTLMKSIKEAAELHLETVIKQNLPDTLLNRHAPAEYWEKYFAAARQIEKRPTPSSSFLTVSPYSSQIMPQLA